MEEMLSLKDIADIYALFEKIRRGHKRLVALLERLYKDGIPITCQVNEQHNFNADIDWLIRMAREDLIWPPICCGKTVKIGDAD